MTMNQVPSSLRCVANTVTNPFAYSILIATGSNSKEMGPIAAD